MRFSPRVEALKGKGAAAWDLHAAATRAKAAGEDVVLMSIGDPDLDTPRPVVERAVDALSAGDTHYAPMAGLPALRERVARRFAQGGGPPVGPENVAIVAGAQNGLYTAAQLLFADGDEVILLDPAYVTYEATLRAAGATCVRVPSREDAPLRPDLAGIAAAVTTRTRGILLTNPSNPSGIALTADELAGIARIAVERDLVVIADEVYGALVFGRPHLSIAGLPGMAERTVTVGSLSKSHAMTGWRIGWTIGPAAFTGHAERLALAMTYGISPFVQQAAVEALDRSAEIEAEMRAIYERRCLLVADALDRVAGLSVIRPEGGMFVMLGVTGTGLSSDAFAGRLWREEGVCVLDGAAFGESAAGTVRVSCAIGERDLAEGCARIARFAARCAEAAA